jgi:uncharacterized membrane protein YphA (DoxX/SURF4 family)
VSETTPTGTNANAPSAAGPGRRAHIALYALQILLALFYAGASALPKLIGASSAEEAFRDIDMGTGAMHIIGALELAGAIALVIPVLSSVAAAALGALMIGACVTLVNASQGKNVVMPLVMIILLGLIAWARRGQNAELLRLLRLRK